MPMQRSRYPPNWEAISRQIRFERAGNRCEWCGAPNGVGGYRDPEGRFWSIAEVDEAICTGRLESHCFEDDSPVWRPVKIVLTVAHLGTDYPDGRPGDKHDKMDVRPENLAALCQRCHLNFDRDEHKHNAALTRRRKVVEAGQMELFEQ